MLKNYVKVAWRNLQRGRIYSVINLLGLASGLACFFFIVLFVKDELSYDHFHSKGNRIYRVIEFINMEGSGEQSSSCPFPVGPTLQHDYPQYIEQCVRFFNFQDPQHTLGVGEKKFNESRIYVADSGVFKVFDFKLAEGDPDKALSQPASMVITRRMAQKYFGDEPAVGKSIRYDGVLDVQVTGILEEVPAQSHIHFDALLSFATVNSLLGPNAQKNWVWNPNWTYLLLKEGVRPEQLESQFEQFVKKYYPDFLQTQTSHKLQPLFDIHLRSKYSYEIEANNDISNIYIFALIGIFILFIACVNFMNLATARSAGRAKEVGVRKTMGADRRQLILQFLAESVMLSLCSVFLALVLVELLLPFFNQVAGKQIELSYLASGWLILVMFCTAAATGIVAGIYPAFYLSAFVPAQVLKGNMAEPAGWRGVSLRKVLVVLQFIISVVLIVCTGVVYAQLNYMRSANLGFNKSHIMMLPVRPPMSAMYDSFMEELRRTPQVESVASMNDRIGIHHNIHEFNYKGMQPGKWIYFPSLLVNEDFVSTMGMQIIAGRDFSRAYPRDDSLAVIINEAMLKQMGWKTATEALGQQMYTPGGTERVVGVVKDFHFVSLSSPVGPFVLDIPHRKARAYWTRFICLRLKAGDIPATIHAVREVWNKYAKDFPFEYSFLDEDLNKQYEAEEKISKLATYFSVLAIFIACLGLFALTTFSTEQRTKEIGIRKVMGASAAGIVLLLSREFLWLVGIANLVAWPLAWFFTRQWLNNFAFRTDISILLFIVAGVGTLFIALFTMSFQALRAAFRNPVRSLRYE